MKNLLLLIMLFYSIIGYGQMNRTIARYGMDGNMYIYTPPEPTKDVILFLHGLGERGSTIEDLSLVERNEIPKLFKSGVVKPYIVLAPQLKKDVKSWGRNQLIPLLNILDGYKIQGYDIHVTGLSLGGMGTYGIVQYAYAYNDSISGYFKTIAPVCGSSSLTNWKIFENSFVKIYHGTSDGTVRIGQDYRIFKLLQDNNINVQGVFYEGSGHNIWGTAYNDSSESYWSWLLEVDPPVAPTPKESINLIYIMNGEGVIETNSNIYKFDIIKIK